ncbi:MAG: hypothetical protein IJI20_03210 [Firmicutes bacterium]|nr:hypothetical protein [Bacillota bacterium]
MEIKILKNGYKMKDAYERLVKRSKHFTIENMDLLFYPYLLIEYDIDFGRRLEKLNERVIVMADMFRGGYSFARSRGSFARMEVEEETVMPVKMDRRKAIKEGPRTVYGEIMRKKKVLRTPDIEYIDDEVVYKPFYIVECTNEEGETFHILFDAVTGDFSLLNA